MAASPAVPAPLAQIPNALTLLRLALIPLFVVLMLGDDPANWPAGLVFAAAGITDQVDGFLARRWHVESQFGKVADPLADRLMIDAAAVLLATWVLYAAIGLVIVTDPGVDWPVWLFWAGVALALVAAAQYVQKARREVRT